MRAEQRRTRVYVIEPIEEKSQPEDEPHHPEAVPEFELGSAHDNGESGLAWRHADGPIQPDHFAVQHRILDNLPGQLRIFRRASQPFGKRNHGAE